MSRKVWILLLYSMDAIIILLGILYCIYSVKTGDTFRVLRATIPGYIFGATAVFLGIRYFKSIVRLNRAINSSNASFSWRNFIPKTGESK